MEYKIKGGLTLILTKEDIERIEYIHARQPVESIRNAYKRTGCDVIINANFFDMKTGATQGHVTDEGKVISKTGNPFGYAFVDKKWAEFSYNNNVNAPDFVSGTPVLLRNGQDDNNSKDPSLSITSKVKRGRTAIGNNSNQLIIRCIPDNWRYPRKTTKELAKEMRALGCINAINLDGGGSTQYITPWSEYVSGRPVDGFIAIWLKARPKDDKPLEVDENIIHVVKRGETLSGIGRLYGLSYWKIATDNNIKNPNRIKAGQKLIIKK